MAVIDKYGRVHNYGYFYNPEVSSPYISIKPNYMCTYLRHFSHKPPSDSSGALCSRCHNLLSSDEYSAHPGLCNSCVNLTNNKSSGDISSAGRSRLLLAFDWMLLFSKSKQAYNDNLKSWYNFKLAMLTVKLPCKQLHDDNFIKSKILNNFLTQCRQKFHMNFYIWKAEKGFDEILHFHIIHDCYIDKLEINKIWNNCIRNHGYIDQYRRNQQSFHKDGFRYRPELFSHWSKTQQRNAYVRGCATNWNHPTSTTTINSLKHVKNARAYCAKYVSKNNCINKKIEQYENKYKEEHGISEISADIQKAIADIATKSVAVYGRTWFISRSLSQLGSITSEITTSIDDAVINLIQSKAFKVISKDYAKIITCSIHALIKSCSSELISIVKNFFIETRSKFLPQPELIFSSLGIPLNLWS